MAIKKGAFELYTQERTLPAKGKKNSSKKNHFFDNSYEENNGSQLVQDWLTEEHISFEETEGKTNNKLKLNKDVYDKNDDRNELLIENNNGSQKVHKSALNPTLIYSKTVSKKIQINSKISFSRLVGNQRDVIFALYKNMRINKSDTTEELTLEMIAALAGVNLKSLKNTLFRLTNSGYLIRAEHKAGRGGWVKYQVSEQIIYEIQQKDLFYNNIKSKI